MPPHPRQKNAIFGLHKDQTMRFLSFALLIAALLSLSCNEPSPVTIPAPITVIPGKPDLVIDTITYTHLSGRHYDQYGNPWFDPGEFEFILTIKNIGKVDVTSFIFIDNSRTKTDFDAHYCSSGHRANDPIQPLPAGASIQVKLTTSIDENVPNVLFRLDTNNFYHLPGTLPIIDELNYDNNTYAVALNW
jgi:hypothetical protein